MSRNSTLSVAFIALTLSALIGCESAEQKACREDGAAATTAWAAAATAVTAARTTAAESLTAGLAAADQTIATAEAALATATTNETELNARIATLTDAITAKCTGDVPACVQGAVTAATAIGNGEAAQIPAGLEAEVTEAAGAFRMKAANDAAKTAAQGEVDAAKAAKAAGEARKGALDGLEGTLADIGMAAGKGQWGKVAENAAAIGTALADSAPAELQTAIDAISKAQASCPKPGGK